MVESTSATYVCLVCGGIVPLGQTCLCRMWRGTQHETWNYQCPNCGGKFQSFIREDFSSDSPERCPFCGMEKFKYPPKKEATDPPGMPSR